MSLVFNPNSLYKFPSVLKKKKEKKILRIYCFQHLQ